MFRITTLLKFLFISLLMVGGGSSAQLADSAHVKRSQLEPRNPRLFLLIVQGLFRSKDKNIVKVVSCIPCRIIEALENDADAAKEFIEQLQRGEKPRIITELPENVLEILIDVIRIFQKLPSPIGNVPGEIVSDIAKVFDDIGSGAIGKALKKIPNIASDLLDGLGDLVSKLKKIGSKLLDKAKCLILDCPRTDTVAHICGLPDIPTNLPDPDVLTTLPDVDPIIPDPAQPSPIVPLATPTRPPGNNVSYSGPSPSAIPSPLIDNSRGTQLMSHLSILQLCCVAATGVFGLAFLL